MTEPIGSQSNPLRVAVVGSGPAGFYAADALLKAPDVEVAVDVFEKLPTPFGLVRAGVAPDHQKLKSVIKIYERTAGKPGFRYFGNVEVGRDLTLAEMLRHYHHVVIAVGSETDRKLGIPGEDLSGSYAATQFVGWYNGHPDFTHYRFDLDVEQVAVIGNGNVAMDVVRILAQPLHVLEHTDITDYALETLRRSRIREIHLLGRRGPAQAAFTNPEIRELTQLEGWDLVVRPEDLELDEHSRAAMEQSKDPTPRRNVDILAEQAKRGEGEQARKIRARFFVSPVEVLGTDRMEGLRIEHNELVPDQRSGRLRAQGTGRTEELSAGLMFRSIGYKGVPFPEVPFDERRGVIPNEGGRVTDPETGRPLPRVYVAGWIKRGPTGVIGTNKQDAINTVNCLLEDTPALQPGEGFQPDPEAVPALLRQKGVRWVSYEDWKRIDAAETARGEPQGRPRVKFTDVDEMLEVLR